MLKNKNDGSRVLQLYVDGSFDAQSLSRGSDPVWPTPHEGGSVAWYRTGSDYNTRVRCSSASPRKGSDRLAGSSRVRQENSQGKKSVRRQAAKKRALHTLTPPAVVKKFSRKAVR